MLSLQRDRKERKHYTDDWALGDEEIEGRRSFRLDDKMESDRFPQCFVKEMVGSGMLIVSSSPPRPPVPAQIWGWLKYIFLSWSFKSFMC
jgi:hypothetical protein